MIHSVRFASRDADYPLQVTGPASWRQHSTSEANPAGSVRTPAGGFPMWRATVPLPNVPADHIVAASLASLPAPVSFSFRLECHLGEFTTATFGEAHATAQTTKAPNAHLRAARVAGVTVPIDYFDTTRPLKGVHLHVDFQGSAPARYLFVVSARPRVMPAPSPPLQEVEPLPASSLSQTTLDDGLRHQACSPTATAMALRIEDDRRFREFVSRALHPTTGLCGVWPQNVWAAAAHGRLVGVELMSDWDDAGRALVAGSTVVASLRFGSGALPGSPIEQTGGHLVLLRGIDGGQVVVNDPAAPPGQVERLYPAGAFGAAWLRHRGAAYVLAAP